MKKKLIALISTIMLLMVVTSCGLYEDVEECAYNTFTETTYQNRENSGFEYWSLLSAQGSMVYDAVMSYNYKTSKIYHFKNEKDIDKNEVEKALQYCEYDHPEKELMALKICYEDSKSGGVDLKIIPDVDKKTYEYKLNMVNQCIESVINQVSGENEKIEKYRLIYKFLTENVKYGESSNSPRDIFGTIAQKNAVCDGIADAFKYICNCCNLECVSVTGNTEGSGHKWNLAKINDTWYLLDPTFDLGGKDNFFLKKDIKGDARIPWDIGVPGYSSYWTLSRNAEVQLTYYSVYPYGVINTSEDVWIEFDNGNAGYYGNGMFFYDTKARKISSNGTIYLVEMFDWRGRLLSYTEGKKSVEINPTYDESKVSTMTLHIEYEGVKYKADFIIHS